jgi:hypothetical protein
MGTDELGGVIRELSQRVAELEGRLSKYEGRGYNRGLSDDKLAMVARSIYRTRQQRVQYFGSDLFSEPAWDMLLDLFMARVRGARISTTSLCIAGSAPFATGQRWIRQLEDHGLLRRFRAADDSRLRLVEITPKAYQLMRECMSAAIAKCEWMVPD